MEFSFPIFVGTLIVSASSKMKWNPVWSFHVVKLKILGIFHWLFHCPLLRISTLAHFPGTNSLLISSEKGSYFHIRTTARLLRWCAYILSAGLNRQPIELFPVGSARMGCSSAGRSHCVNCHHCSGVLCWILRTPTGLVWCCYGKWVYIFRHSNVRFCWGVFVQKCKKIYCQKMKVLDWNYWHGKKKSCNGEEFGCHWQSLVCDWHRDSC